MDKEISPKIKKRLKIALIALIPFTLYAACTILAFDFLFKTCTGLQIYMLGSACLVLSFWYATTKIEKAPMRLALYIQIAIFVLFIIAFLYDDILKECMVG